MSISDQKTDDFGYTTGRDGVLYEICTDELGRRLWINSEDGSAVARFNTQTGVDVHNTVTDQLAGEPECLWCTHGKPDHKTWQKFIQKVKELFGLTLPSDAIEVRFLESGNPDSSTSTEPTY